MFRLEFLSFLPIRPSSDHTTVALTMGNCQGVLQGVEASGGALVFSKDMGLQSPEKDR